MCLAIWRQVPAPHIPTVVLILSPLLLLLLLLFLLHCFLFFFSTTSPTIINLLILSYLEGAQKEGGGPNVFMREALNLVDFFVSNYLTQDVDLSTLEVSVALCTVYCLCVHVMMSVVPLS